ncbi:MAG: hypothetical protein BGN88_01675 [Clostridiales bacterium 43-6]|nr:MAG: hypothetical protein BGN88_01675 [Clostridiales bacterium 43-6]
MAVIRPSSDLCNRYGEISEFCNQQQEPVFTTRNGTGDLVVMSNAEYERLSGKCELYRMLDAGLADAESGKSRKTKDVFSDIERKYGLGKA